MDEHFQQLISELHGKYQELISMSPVSIDTVSANCPTGGVYLFSENGKNLYAGRTKRKISLRLKGHVNTANDCPFAWRLAREEMRVEKASYKTKLSRKDLLSQPEFKKAYESAKNHIRIMDVRFVGEQDPLKQALLEIYVSVISNAKYNDFDTH